MYSTHLVGLKETHSMFQWETLNVNRSVFYHKKIIRLLHRVLLIHVYLICLTPKWLINCLIINTIAVNVMDRLGDNWRLFLLLPVKLLIMTSQQEQCNRLWRKHKQAKLIMWKTHSIHGEKLEPQDMRVLVWPDTGSCCHIVVRRMKHIEL